MSENLAMKTIGGNCAYVGVGVEFDICGDGESRLHQVIKPYLLFLPEYLQSLLPQLINSANVLLFQVSPSFTSEPGISLKFPGLG